MSALDGIRVLDLGRYLAAPWAAQLLGDYGAEVIKVERPGVGDQFRQYGSSYLHAADGSGSETGYYLAANRNKRSITVDLSLDEGARIVRDLASRSDILIENFKVGDLARRGLAFSDLCKINPGLIYCSITAFGQSGPYASRPGLDSVFQAMSGLMSVTGEPDRPPQKVGVTIIDLLTGVYATTAILAALHHRERTGEGQHIDLALMDTAIAAMSHRAQDYLLTGEIPKRAGSATIGSTPAQVFATADGAVNVQAGDDSAFASLCTAFGREDLRDDPRYIRRPERWANRASLLPELEHLFAKRSTANLLEMLVKARIICAPIYSVDQALADPQIQSRNMVTHVNHPLRSDLPLIANPVRFSATPIGPYAPPPLLGSDTEQVLGELLGLDQSDIAGLRQRQVL